MQKSFIKSDSNNHVQENMGPACMGLLSESWLEIAGIAQLPVVVAGIAQLPVVVAGIAQLPVVVAGIA